MAALATAALLSAAAVHAAPRRPPAPAAAPAAAPSVRGAVDLWRAGDYAGAVAMWMPFANAGDPDAMFNIGQAYKLGRSVPRDAVVARDWYRRAAMKGHLPAQANLGILLFQAGEKPEAMRWLRAAADKGEMRAQYVLGVANWNGDGLPRNLTLAYAYLQRAAAQGLAEASPAVASLTAMMSPLERANGWAVATSLAGGNGIPPAFAGPPTALASTDSYRRDQVIKPMPAPVPAPAPVVRPAPVAVAAVTPPAPVAVVAAATPVPVTPPPQVAVVRPPAPAVATVAIPDSPPAPAVIKPPAPVVVAQVPTLQPAPAVQPAPAPAPRPVTPPVVVAAQPPLPKPAPAPKPAAKPVQVAAAKPVPKVPTGWRVQLGAFSKKALAEAAWTDVKTRQKQLVGTTKPIFSADGSVTKLQMGPYASKAAARDACARIAFTGLACFVTEG